MAIEGYPELNIPPSQLGTAQYCVTSVFLNLLATQALQIWVQWIFLLIPLWDKMKYSKSDLATTVSQAKLLFRIVVVVLILIFVVDAPDWVLELLILYQALNTISSFHLKIQELREDDSLKNDKSSSSMAKKGLMWLYAVPDPEEEVHDHQE
jgi:hypothetical protein